MEAPGTVAAAKCSVEILFSVSIFHVSGL